ncbi:hypothetical protein Pint_10634 [Pistacia integerrima]|uniref:Uncharacterized protein n=1 Tax=Pistacia integerrima TaxID=434235 RepID=A0ACC0XKZ3_9ROSI|nr:hypothetical protein Pint_10634 [Pistacia integerrima]
MIVRTYGRRNRGITRTYSDTIDTDDDVVLDESFRDSFSLSQDTPQDLYSLPFSSSQDSSPLWSSQEPDYNNNSVQILPSTRPLFTNSDEGVVGRRSKKQKKGSSGPLIPATSTLMEAQEFGEMMEHVDEVNFAIDGLKKGSQVRIRRASLLSLLSICGTVQQRRLLRTQGLARTIIEAILGLSSDDSLSNLAAATLLYVLTSDGQDDHLLESHSCIHFLIKLLKPVISTAAEDKARKIGSKLLALRKDADIIRDATKTLDSSSSAILSKVQKILVSCKELKSSCGDDDGIGRPELSAKWMALLTIEKACLSKISFEDATGAVRKTGGNFKEKLRELGGLDAVFEVILNCYSVMEGWILHSSPSIQTAKHNLDLQSLVFLLKCLKIMENATFLSKDNQSHLLGMKGNLISSGPRQSFTEIVISVIKTLSDLYLHRSSSTSADDKSYNLSDGNGTGHASELALITDCKENSNEVIFISSSKSFSSTELISSEKSFRVSQNSRWLSTDRLGHSESNSETTTTLMNDSCILKMRSRSSLSTSCSGTPRSSDSGPLSGNGSRTKFGPAERPNSRKDDKCGPFEDSEDPFAFDADDFEPSKWDLLSGKHKKPQTKKSGVMCRDLEDECQYEMMMSQPESRNGENHQLRSGNGLNHQPLSNGGNLFSQESSCSLVDDKENSDLLADCLLTAVKVLMNLTNDNPVGCQQIASCGGLETMSLLIASHFPSFSKSLSHCRDSSEFDHQDDRPMTDQELDFLVAILGLLVNLVEKDGLNRLILLLNVYPHSCICSLHEAVGANSGSNRQWSRLAAARVPLPNSKGLEAESHGDVIPLLCSIFLANHGAGDVVGEGNAGDEAGEGNAREEAGDGNAGDEAGDGDAVPWDAEEAVLQGEKEAEKMILEAYAALLLAFLSTESADIRGAIAECLPNRNLAILVPVLERFVAFHLTLNMISEETHIAVSEVIESLRVA